jgi:Zn-dependent M28 family amino/carboxypeptidase
VTRRYATRIPLVTARLAGESEREILVVSHLCHPRPGANDNASGAAAALEAARTLAASRHASRCAAARCPCASSGCRS